MTSIEKSKDSIFQRGFGWTYVGEEMAKKYNSEINTFVARMKVRGECLCPREAKWYCDQDCNTCKYHRNVDEETASAGIIVHSDRCAHRVYEICSLDAKSPNCSDDETFADIIPDSTQPFEENIEKRELDKALLESLKDLSEKDRSILQLSFIEKMPDSVIAQCLGINARKTLNNHKLRILRTLRENLKNFS